MQKRYRAYYETVKRITAAKKKEGVHAGKKERKHSGNQNR